jgi:putative flippase GtrA
VPSPADLLALTRTPSGRKMIRYSMVSAISVVVSTVVLTLLVGVLRWSAFSAALTATAVATVPSYELNRKWAWGKSGRSHFWKEVAPFWSLSFIGLAFSTWTSVIAERYSKQHHLSHVVHTAVVEGAFIGAFGVLWVGKFVLFNKVLFAHHPDDLPPALDGRTGLPG